MNGPMPYWKLQTYRRWRIKNDISISIGVSGSQFDACEHLGYCRMVVQCGAPLWSTCEKHPEYEPKRLLKLEAQP